MKRVCTLGIIYLDLHNQVILTGLFVGPVFQKEVDPIEYSSVSLISEQEFIDLTASNISPKVSEETSELIPLGENEDQLIYFSMKKRNFKIRRP